MASGSNRAEAERWLITAEKVLSARDFHGARTFAIRARESDPGFEAPNQVLAVADTIIAAESVIVTVNGNQHNDWYAILQLARFTQSSELIASQFHKLVMLLSPTRNRLPFSDLCYRLVTNAWSVLSNPSSKQMYDTELQLSQLGERQRQTPQMPPPPPPLQWQMAMQQPPPPPQPQPLTRRSSITKENVSNNTVILQEAGSNLNNVTESTRQAIPFLTESTRPAQPEPARPSHAEPTPARPSQAEPAPAPARPSQAEPAPAPARPSQAEPTPAPARPSQAEPGHPKQAEATSPNQEEPTRLSETESEVPSFWTACPYCYVLYEYPKIYEECTLRCQSCKRAFHAVMIASPPVTAKDKYFCSWGFFPVGYSEKAREKGGNYSSWTPVSPMFPCPMPGDGKSSQGKSKQVNYRRATVLYDAVPISSDSESSEESDDDWGGGKRRRKVKNVRGKGNEGKKRVGRPPGERGKKVNQNHSQNQTPNQNVEGVVGTSSGSGSRVLRRGGKKQMGNGLDLNVEFSNELEDPVVTQRGNQVNGEEDNIDGVGFFEGLDEFLSSLPILNVVKDDKVKSS